MNQALIPAAISFAALPALGASLADGTFRGITTLPDGTHAAVILLPNKAQERMSWQKAMAWAEGVGGQLPSRPVAALLYANAKAEFEPNWHWTNEPHSDSCAWLQTFGYGFQDCYTKDYEFSAVAVRLIQLTP